MIKKYKPHLNIGPGAFIKEELKARNWRQEDLAEIMGMSPKSINQLIKNKQAITVETAQLLSKAFGQSPQYWLALDANYRLRLKQDKKREKRVNLLANIFKYMPIKEMIKKHWLKKYKKPDELKNQIHMFCEKKTLDFSWMETVKLPNLRKSDAYDQYNLYYTYTWFNMAKRCAKMYKTGKYRKRELQKIINNFASYSCKKKGTNNIIKDLDKAGVKFFILSHLQKTYLDGASFYDKNNPVVAYTMRYNRIDNFWFTLAHEIAHIILHINNKSDYFVDNLDAITTEQEEEANDYACKMIKAEQIKEYFKDIDNYISEWRVNDCAEKVEVSPALVVGVLQHEGKLSRRNLNRLKEPVANRIPRKYWVEKNIRRL